MKVNKIVYSSSFIHRLKKLPKEISKIIIKKEQLLKSNPLHPPLRLHALRGKLLGYWSISLNSNYRIIFEQQENGEVLFMSVGKHDIYKSL